MNLPVGDIIEENLILSEVDVKGLIEALIDRQFTGYIVNTIEGIAGIEEGVLLFKKGDLLGSFYEYTNHEKSIFGKNAIDPTFNSLAAEKGIMDIISLSSQQADLVTAFNDKIKIVQMFKRSELLGLVRRRFSTSFAQNTLKNVVGKGESRKSVLKRLGLSEIR